MDVKQVRQCKRELEAAIRDLISKFQTETGCNVEEVFVGRQTMVFGASLTDPPRIVSIVTVRASL